MKQEFLNEENYQKSNKKVKLLALLIFIIGLLIGGGLITVGAVKMATVVPETTVESRSESDVQAEIDAINEELVPLKAQQNKEFRENGFSEEYYRLGNEIDKRQSELTDLQTELFKVKNGYYDQKNDATNTAQKMKYLPLIIFGAFILISSVMISLFVFSISKRREIMAYSTQQVMPVAQEGIEKMSSTMGTVAKEITKGIKNGLSDTKDDE